MFNSSDEVATRERVMAFGALTTSCLAVLLVLLDNTVVVVALPTLANDLQADFSGLQWVVDSYTLPFAGLLLMFGHLGDRYGRRRILIGGLIGIALLSVVGGLADTMAEILVARVGMGIAAAAVFPATLAAITTVYRTPRARAVGIACWTAMAGFAVAVGPTVGGWLIDRFVWQAIFWMNIPIALLAIAMTFAFVRESRPERRGSLDLIGVALSIFGITLLVWSMIEAPRYGWLHPLTIGATVAALLILALFVLREIQVPNPVLDVRLFAIRRFAFPVLALAVSYFALFGFLFLVSQYFQAVLLMDPLTFGIHSLPFAAAIGAGAPIGAWLGYRYGHTGIVLAGLLLFAGGLFWASRATVATTYWDIPFWSMLLMGTGVGIATGPVTDSIMASVPHAEAGAGSAVNDTTREVGGALGIALFGSVLVSQYTDVVTTKLESYGSILNSFVSEREFELLVHSPVSLLQLLDRPGLPAVVTDLDDPNSLVSVMQQATLDGWRVSATLMTVSVLAVAVIFGIFMPWSRGASLYTEKSTQAPTGNVRANDN